MSNDEQLCVCALRNRNTLSHGASAPGQLSHYVERPHGPLGLVETTNPRVARDQPVHSLDLWEMQSVSEIVSVRLVRNHREKPGRLTKQSACRAAPRSGVEVNVSIKKAPASLNTPIQIK